MPLQKSPQNLRLAVARNMLAIRRDGPTIHLHLKHAWKSYLGMLFILLTTGVVCYFVDMISFVPIYGAFFVGAFIRDLGWIRKSKIYWPIQRDFIAWNLVEKAAEDSTKA